MSNPIPTSPAQGPFIAQIHQCALSLVMTMVSQKKSDCSIPFKQLEEFLALPQASEGEARDIATYAEWIAQVKGEARTSTMTTFQPLFIESEIDKAAQVLRLRLNPLLAASLAQNKAPASNVVPLANMTITGSYKQ